MSNGFTPNESKLIAVGIAGRKFLGESLFGIALLAGLALPALAQAPAANPPSASPLSAWLKTAYTNNHNTILRTAEKMPEENYGMRPGSQQEVRTFGQQVGHVARYNFLWCAQAKGEKNPKEGVDLEKLATPSSSSTRPTHSSSRESADL